MAAPRVPLLVGDRGRSTRALPVRACAQTGRRHRDPLRSWRRGRLRQAALDLLLGGGGAASLPLVDTSPGRQFDWQLAYKLTPKEYLRRLRVPTVRQAKATVVGPLDKDLIRHTVREHIDEIRNCYEQSLEIEPNLKGRVVVEFTILGDGKVGESAAGESTIDDPDVDACIGAAPLGWRFPKPEGGATVTVSYPFVLEPG